MILGKEQTCCVKESVYLDSKLRYSAIYIVWVKVVLETEVNCEKRLFKVLLCTRDVHRSEKYVATCYYLSEHVQFVTFPHVIFVTTNKSLGT